MAQNVTIAGASYSAVPSIEVPKTGGGTAVFADPSVVTAVAADVAQGKYFLDSAGTLTEGTNPGGGGGASVEIGTFKVTSDISITTAQTDVTIGFSGQPDFIYCWMDKDTFNAISSPVNHTWYRWSLAKNNTSLTDSFPPIRINNSTNAQSSFGSTIPYICVAWTNVSATTDPNSVNGYSVYVGGYATANASGRSINSNGTITLTRAGNATQTILAGDYHYIAITGASMYQI